MIILCAIVLAILSFVDNVISKLYEKIQNNSQKTIFMNLYNMTSSIGLHFSGLQYKNFIEKFSFM